MTKQKSVIVFGKNKEKVESLVKEKGFLIVENNPDFIVSFGGDGTAMRAEHQYPEVPKILLRDSHICKLCSQLTNEDVLDRVVKGEYKIEKYWKLEATAFGKTLYSLNDIVIHNADPRHAIRYDVAVNGKEINKGVIGDGVVISTPFGSTGYYRSITDSYFETGLGIAFNNSTEQSDHIVLFEDRVISVRISRGPALIYADNQEERLELREGDEITIKKSDKIANIVKLNQ